MPANSDNTTFISRNKWLLGGALITVLVLSIAYYLYADRLAELGIINRYDQSYVPLADDSLYRDTTLDIPALPLVDSSGQDSLELIAAADTQLVIVSTDTLLSPPYETAVNVADTVAITVERAMVASNYQNDLFDDLLPEIYQSDAARAAFLDAYQRTSVSTRGLFKLAAVAGRAYLLDSSAEMQQIFRVLEAEASVSGILLANRAGLVVYATNAKLKGQQTATVYPDLPVGNESLNWMRKETQIITGIPLFGLGGRNGTVYLVME